MKELSRNNNWKRGNDVHKMGILIKGFFEVGLACQICTLSPSELEQKKSPLQYVVACYNTCKGNNWIFDFLGAMRTQYRNNSILTHHDVRHSGRVLQTAASD